MRKIDDIGSMIPKIFHQIWLGSEMPVVFKTLRDRMLTLHPDWEYKLWTEENLPEIINVRYFDMQTRHLYKADILRYEILAHYGGVYVDTDFYFYKNIEPLLRNTDHFLAYETRDWVCNSILAFEPNHWFMWEVINRLPEKCLLYPDRWGVDLVGPGLITECSKKHPNMLILPRQLFYPLFADDVKLKQFEVQPAAYAAHLWNDVVGTNNIQVHKRMAEYVKYASEDVPVNQVKQVFGHPFQRDQRPGVVNRENTTHTK